MDLFLDSNSGAKCGICWWASHVEQPVFLHLKVALFPKRIVFGQYGVRLRSVMRGMFEWPVTGVYSGHEMSQVHTMNVYDHHDRFLYSGSGSIVRQSVGFSALIRQLVHLVKARARRENHRLRRQHVRVVKVMCDLVHGKAREEEEDTTFPLSR